MNIKLLSLDIENFQGTKQRHIDCSGQSVTLAGKNGAGKTTVCDAFNWCFFEKDSDGKATFDIRPYDENHIVIKGLVTTVTTVLAIDGIEHTFKKQLEEKVVKGQSKGYETSHWIDEVYKKAGEYKAAISEIIPEETFRLLTDLKYFCEDEKHGGMHWTKRRAILLEVAGEIGEPEGFDELLANLKGRTIAQYKSVLKDRKAELVEERDKVNTRIDENSRKIPLEPVQDTSGIEKTRTELQAAVKELDQQRTAITTSEQARQKQIDHLNNLKAKRIQREAELKSDTGNIKPMLNEKAEIESGVADKKRALTALKTDLSSAETIRKSKQATADNCLRIRNDIRAEYDTAKAATDPDICSLCGQKLPEDKLAEIAEKKAAMLVTISERGRAAKAALDKAQNEVAAADANIAGIKERFEKAQIELTEAETYAAERLAKIAELIKSVSSVGTKPQDDTAWNTINDEIIALEKSIGPAASDQLSEIESQRTKLTNDIETLNTALKNADTIKEAKVRIAELELQEKDFAQKIANVEKELADIDAYGMALDAMIVEAVNGKFKYVTFKMFETNLNGSTEPCCEAIWNGKPYSALSTGESIFVGIDIVNTLSKHYDLSCPLLLDHAESLTLPNESESQTIELYADRNVDELTLTLKEEENGNSKSESKNKTKKAGRNRQPSLL